MCIWRCLREAVARVIPEPCASQVATTAEPAVWWGHPQEGSCCHCSRCILILAQGCAHDVSGDCDITGWRRSEKGVPGAPTRGPGPGLTRWRTPRRTQQVSPLSWKAGRGVLGELGVGWEPCLPGAKVDHEGLP